MDSTGGSKTKSSYKHLGSYILHRFKESTSMITTEKLLQHTFNTNIAKSEFLALLADKFHYSLVKVV